jgi:hypothetical protein
MAVNYVKGQILSGILERDGIDISIANANVGINTITPAAALDVAGNILVGTVTISNIGTISASGNITSGNLLTGNIIIPSLGNINAGNVNIANLAEPAVASDAATKFYVDNTVANVGTIGNLQIANTTITTDGTIGNIVLQPTGAGLVVIDAATGLVIPVGNTTQRPSPAVTGTMRFNTETLRVEVYDGTEWDTIVGGVTNQTLDGDGSTVTFVLNRSTTTAAVLVILNGITQVPDQAYAMVPTPSANLVFTEAPAQGDVIDIRFL